VPPRARAHLCSPVPDEPQPIDATPATPKLFYGWVMLGVAVLMAAATMPGQTVLMALFNASIRESLGLSIGQISAAYTIGTILASLPLPLVGRIADTLGLRGRSRGSSSGSSPRCCCCGRRAGS
jgi:MFS family permease